MKRFLAAALLAVTLALPSSASAYFINLQKFGVNSSAYDLSTVSSNDILFASIHGQHLRVFVDCVHGSNAGFFYADKLHALYSNGVDHIAVLGWKNPDGSWRDIDTAGERQQLQDCAYNYARQDRNHAAWNGQWPSNVYEAWNEPNCVQASQECRFSGFTSVADYWNNAFVPIRSGVRSLSGDTNIVVGGLGFGCTTTQGCSSGQANGFNDAANWITAIHNNGWANGNDVNAYSVHPYGYTSYTGGNPLIVRDPTSEQTCAKARFELDRAKLGSASKDVIVTEFGRRTDVFSEPSQTGYMDCMDSSDGVVNAKVNSMWPLTENGQGLYTSALLRADLSGKPAYYYWAAAHDADGQWPSLTP